MSDNPAIWRPNLARSLHLNRSLIYSRYFQLATVRQDGKPSNRTVVFRGFLDNSDIIKIITDSRSQKIDELEEWDFAEICWYFPKTREQFRISGNIEIVSVNSSPGFQKTRADMWRNLSDAARVQFLWPHPRHNRDSNPSVFTPDLPDENLPVDNFCLLLFTPTSVDHLELKGNPQNRTIYTLRENSWTVESVNP